VGRKDTGDLQEVSSKTVHDDVKYTEMLRVSYSVLYSAWKQEDALTSKSWMEQKVCRMW